MAWPLMHAATQLMHPARTAIAPRPAFWYNGGRGSHLPAGMLQLHIDQVSKRFGRRRVLEAVQETAKSGECLVVTGRNGSGKSTLLAIIAGLQRPTKGRVRLIEQDAELAGDDRRDAIGLVSPDLTLYAELTALENLRLFAALRALEPAEAELVAGLERVGLGGRSGDRVGEFSSGMRVRLKYAAALLHEPVLLLLDEPTANLDATGVRLVEQIVSEQRGRGILVLATNEPDEARFADRTISLGEA